MFVLQRKNSVIRNCRLLIYLFMYYIDHHIDIEILFSKRYEIPLLSYLQAATVRSELACRRPIADQYIAEAALRVLALSTDVADAAAAARTLRGRGRADGQAGRT